MPPLCDCGKAYYPHKRAALHQARYLNKMHERGGVFHAYQCRGGYWHIGHRTRSWKRVKR